MSSSLSDLFERELNTQEKDLRSAPEVELQGMRHELPPEQTFSTANWVLRDGRTARSAASIVHCEQAGFSRLKNALLRFFGRGGADSS